MYWEYPVEGVQPIGYSYAWGDMPDNQADTTGNFYQTPSDLLGDGIRVFSIKAENSGGNWGDTGAGSPWCGPSGAGGLGARELEVLEWCGGRWGAWANVGPGGRLWAVLSHGDE